MGSNLVNIWCWCSLGRRYFAGNELNEKTTERLRDMSLIYPINIMYFLCRYVNSVNRESCVLVYRTIAMR